MEQLSAFNLLLEFEKRCEVEILSHKNTDFNICDYFVVLEIDPVPSNYNEEAILRDQFLKQHHYTGNSFIQICKKGDLDTQIATFGAPFAPTYTEILFQSELFESTIKTLQSFDKFTVQEINHSSFTCQVSFCQQLDSFSISSNSLTIVCFDERDISLYQDPMHERPCKIARQFFEYFNSLSRAQQDNLISDLKHRSLVGYSNYRYNIEWFALIEHYGLQRLLPPKVVSDFLRHYKLNAAESLLSEQTIDGLQKMCKSIHNRPIEDYHDYFKGKTLYFWQGDTFLGNCFVPYKHYQILYAFKKQWRDPKLGQKDVYKYLNQFQLTDRELDFYTRYTDLMMTNNQRKFTQIKDNYYFTHVTQLAFNCIHRNLKKMPEKIDQKLNLAQCQSQTYYVIIPLGLKGMGYENLCQVILKNQYDVQIIESPKQITDNHILYLYEHVCTVPKFDQVNKLFQSQNIKTIALIPECSNQYFRKDKNRFPFSFKFIMFCLLSVLDDKDAVKQVIDELKQFENKQFNHPPSDYRVTYAYLPQDKEMDDLYSEIVEQDLEDALTSQNEQLIESLQQYKDSSTIPKNYVKEESRRLITAIEKMTMIELRKRSVHFQIDKSNQQMFGLFIEKPDWGQIDNFIVDCLLLAVKEFPKNSALFQMYKTLNAQLFEGGKTIYQREDNPYMTTKQLYQKSYTTTIQVAIFIADGIVILQPQDLSIGLQQDIPIYSHNVDVIKSKKISELLQRDIRKLQKTSIQEGTVVEQEIRLNSKTWSVYLVKFKPIEIKLVGRVVN